MKKRLFPLTTSGGGGGGQAVLIEKEITENGEYRAESEQADGFSVVNVAVPEPVLTTKSITSNGTYAASGDSADGFSSVTVNVATPQPTLISKSITQNGSYNASADSADGYSSVSVAVPENFEKYHIVATSSNGVVNLAITDYVDQLTDNYYVGTIYENGMQNLYILTEDGEPVVLVPKTITENGTYLPASDNATGYSSVTVNYDTSSITTLKGYLDVKQNGANLFANYTGESVDGIIAYDDTENVTNMLSAFSSCTNLLSVPLLNTSKVTNMQSMFSNCRKLTTIPLYDTNKVTDMSSMFYGCSQLVSVPTFNTGSLTNIGQMFTNCSNLETLPLFDTSKVQTASNFVSGCNKLKVIPAYDFSAVTYFGWGAFEASSLEEIHATGMKVNFGINRSTLFTEAALVEILNNLATVSTTQTLSMGATNLAKLTAEEIAIGTNKGWTIS